MGTAGNTANARGIGRQRQMVLTPGNTPRHRSHRTRIGIASLLALAVTGVALVSWSLPTNAASFTVNSTIDAPDAVPGDAVCATSAGICTLRAAIQEANALSGQDTISVPAGTYVLS